MRSSASGHARLAFAGSMLVFGTIGLLRRFIDLSSAVIACFRGLLGCVLLLLLQRLRGVELTLGDMAMIVLTATLASVGTAGVSGAGMIMLAMVLTQVGLPVEGIAIIAGVDKIFDMGRTTLNITGDATCALFISRLEREKAARKAAKAAK